MRTLTKFLGFIFFHSLAFHFTKFLNSKAGRVPILLYHGIRRGNANAPTCMDAIGMSIPVSLFDEHMSFISKHYSVISLDEYVESRRKKGGLPGNPIIITFDDCFMNNYTEAVPVLRKYSASATFFVIGNTLNGEDVPLHRLYYALDRLGPAGMESVFGQQSGLTIGNGNGGLFFELRKLARSGPESLMALLNASEEACREAGGYEPGQYKSMYMSGRELADLLKKGFSVGGHSMGHESLPSLGASAKKKEIFESSELIRKLAPGSLLHFAYPFGQKKDFDRETRDLLAAAGFSSGLTAVEGLNSCDTDMLELRRIDVREFSTYELAVRTSGIYGTIKDIAKRLLRH